MEKQQQISRHRLAQKISRRLEAITDEKNEEGYLARSSTDDLKSTVLSTSKPIKF